MDTICQTVQQRRRAGWHVVHKVLLALRDICLCVSFFGAFLIARRTCAHNNNRFKAFWSVASRVAVTKGILWEWSDSCRTHLWILRFLRRLYGPPHVGITTLNCPLIAFQDCHWSNGNSHTVWFMIPSHSVICDFYALWLSASVRHATETIGSGVA